MQQSPSFSSRETAPTEAFHVDAAAEFRQRNLLQAAIMNAWLEAHPDEDEIAWVALFAQPFAELYAQKRREIAEDAMNDQKTVQEWLSALESAISL